MKHTMFCPEWIAGFTSALSAVTAFSAAIPLKSGAAAVVTSVALDPPRKLLREKSPLAISFAHRVAASVRRSNK
jgi:hypothetical protein